MLINVCTKHGHWNWVQWELVLLRLFLLTVDTGVQKAKIKISGRKSSIMYLFSG